MVHKDGRTSYERWKGKALNGQLVEFGRTRVVSQTRFKRERQVVKPMGIRNLVRNER